MCLYVKDISNELIVHSYKALYNMGSPAKPLWITPVRYVRVPEDGVLRAGWKAKPIKDNDSIHECAVHAYVEEPFRPVPFEKWFKSYSLDVIAYGMLKDVASRALYIPSLDKSWMKKYRMELIRNPDEVTREDLTEWFAFEGEHYEI